MSREKLLRIMKKSLDFVERHPIVVFLAWAVVCSYEYWIFGNHSYVRIDDNADSTLAAKLGLAHDIAKYGFTWWWDMAVSGADNIALAVVSELDTLPFLILPGWLAYGSVIFLQRFIAGYFTFRLMRDTLDLRTLSSLYAAMAYALFAQNWLLDSWNGFTLYHGFALPSIPLFLLGLYHLSKELNWKNAFLAALLGAYAAISGFFVFVFFVVPFIVYWLIAVNRISLRQLFVPVTLFVGSWLVFELPAQIPAAMNAGLSHRANWSFSDQPWDTALFYLGRMSVDNYIALIVIAAALVFGFIRYKRLGWMILAIIAIAVIMALKPAIALFTERYLGFIQGVQFDRVYLSLPFAVIVIAAVSLDAFFSWKENGASGGAVARIVSKPGMKSLIPAGLVVVVVLLSAVSFMKNERKMFQQLLTEMNYAALFQHPGVAIMKKDAEGAGMYRAATVSTWNNHLEAKNSRIRLIPFNTANLWADDIETADGYVLLYPQRYKMLWSEVLAPRYPASGPDHSQFYVWGGKAYLFFPSDSLQDHAQEFPFESYYNLNILSLLNVRYIVSNFRHPDSVLTPVWDGAKELEQWEHPKGGLTQFKMLLQGKILFNPLFIYRNPYAFPRYFAASGLKTFPTPEALLEALGNASLDDIRNNVYVTDDDSPHKAAVSGLGEGKTRILSYTPDCCRIEVTSKTGCILVASASYNPYWNAYIDGKNAELFPAYYALQGVVVPAGCKTVEFRYEPPYAL